jgi:hypothetical protein
MSTEGRVWLRGGNVKVADLAIRVRASVATITRDWATSSPSPQVKLPGSFVIKKLWIGTWVTVTSRILMAGMKLPQTFSSSSPPFFPPLLPVSVPPSAFLSNRPSGELISDSTKVVAATYPRQDKKGAIPCHAREGS